MADHPVPAGHRELSKKEAEQFIQAAFDAERSIKQKFVRISEAWWDLAKELYEFHEAGYWSALGHTSLDEFLAQPDLGMSRSQFFQMTKLWRDLVVVKKLPPSKLKPLEPSKVREVAPAIMRGEVKPDKALSDAAALSFRDVKAEYRLEEREKRKSKPGDSKLAAENEPQAIKCFNCGNYYTPEPAGDTISGKGEEVKAGG